MSSYDWKETFSSHPIHSERIDFVEAYKKWPPYKLGFEAKLGIVPGDLVLSRKQMYAYINNVPCQPIRSGQQLVLVKFVCIPKADMITTWLIVIKTGDVVNCSFPLNGAHQDYASVKEILGRLHYHYIRAGT